MKSKVIIVLAAALILGNFTARMELAFNNLVLPRGLIETRSLCDLYDGGLLDEVLADSRRDLADKRCEPYLPQILYIRWQTMRRMGLRQQADGVEAEFLGRFPAHPLGARMVWAEAASSLAAGDYKSAGNRLATLVDRYPQSPLSSAARGIRSGLN